MRPASIAALVLLACYPAGLIKRNAAVRVGYTQGRLPPSRRASGAKGLGAAAGGPCPIGMDATSHTSRRAA